MYEDTTVDAPGVAGGISRRDMLRKSAVVGGAGAMIWAAPSITKYGSAAFGSEGTPLDDFSAFGALVNCGEDVYRVKANQEGGTTESIQWATGQNVGNCTHGSTGNTALDEFAADFQAAEDKLGSELGIVVTTISGGVRFTLPSDSPGYGSCTFAGGEAAVIKQGNCCLPASVSSDGKSIDFAGLDPNPNKQDTCEAAGGVWVGN